MNEQSEKKPIQQLADLMKQDWDCRARENAKWYINTYKLEQSDEEFYETARPDIDALLLADMQRLTQGRSAKSLRLLEIGCGIGRMTRCLADIFGAIYATDVSREMIQQAGLHLHSFSNVKVYETSGVDFAIFVNDYFDVIFSAYVFQHVPSIEVVRANIYEAYRVLKPGGVFKFQVNSTVNPAYEQLPKDTWMGVTFSEEEIRQVARELGAQLISLAGIGGQYNWVLLRKRISNNVMGQGMIKVAPCIEGYSYNSSDAPPSQWGISKINATYATLFVSGIAELELDVNQVFISLNNQEVSSCFVMDINCDHETVVQAGIKTAEKFLTLVHFEVPKDLLGNTTDIQVCIKFGPSTPKIPIEMPNPPSPSLKIQLITNGFDGGLDVHAGGAKSKVRLMTEGLEEIVTLNDLSIRVGGWESQPSEIEYLPSNGLYYIHINLPEEMMPGKTEISICYRGLWSEAVPLELQ